MCVYFIGIKNNNNNKEKERELNNRHQNMKTIYQRIHLAYSCALLTVLLYELMRCNIHFACNSSGVDDGNTHICGTVFSLFFFYFTSSSVLMLLVLAMLLVSQMLCYCFHSTRQKRNASRLSCTNDYFAYYMVTALAI